MPPAPNARRHPWAAWDAFVYIDDPDALAREYGEAGIAFHVALRNREDGLRGFEIAIPTATSCSSAGRSRVAREANPAGGRRACALRSKIQPFTLMKAAAHKCGEMSDVDDKSRRTRRLQAEPQVGARARRGGRFDGGHDPAGAGPDRRLRTRLRDPDPRAQCGGSFISDQGDLVPAGTPGAHPPLPRPLEGEEAKQLLRSGIAPPGVDANASQAYANYIRRLQSGVGGFAAPRCRCRGDEAGAMTGPRYIADPPAAMRTVELGGLSALYPAPRASPTSSRAGAADHPALAGLAGDAEEIVRAHLRRLRTRGGGCAGRHRRAARRDGGGRAGPEG